MANPATFHADLQDPKFSLEALGSWWRKRQDTISQWRLDRTRTRKASYAPVIRFKDKADLDLWSIDDLILLNAFHLEAVQRGPEGTHVVMPPMNEAEELLSQADELDET